jgi:uncharacterized small protein (DUF1192 family)
VSDFTKTWDNMNMRERIAHLLADWRRSKDTDDPMVLRVAATMAHHQLEEADAEIEDLEFRLCGTQGSLDNALSRIRTLLSEQEDCRIGADNLDAEIERLRAERDEARRMWCEAEAVGNCLSVDDMYRRARTEAERREWDCYKEPYCFRVNGVVVSKGKAVPPKFELGEDDE